MKHLRILTLFSLLAFPGLKTQAQLAYSPFVDSLSQLADHNTILLLIRQLAGDTTVTIDGITSAIQSRHYLNPNNAKAADFIYQKFSEFGYTPEVQTFSGNRGENVIATKTGIKYPEKEFIICGHYDNMPSGSTAPGADDNGSGTVAVLEAARILAPFDFDYTIRFAAWDEEEIGLVGSYAYAEQAFLQGHQILGVLNLDMIAWDSDNDYTYTIATNDFSQAFTNDYITTTALYQPQFSHNYYYTTASDHASFWEFGYPAFLAIEDWYDFNEYYHTTGDDIPILNMDYFVGFVRAAIANIAAQAWDQRISLFHESLVSGSSTDAREAVLTVNSNNPVAEGENAPRLYYSTGGLEFNYVLPASATGNLYTFMIPGFPVGTEVFYYFALQDSMGRLTATLPEGGRGINPPGTQAPESMFSYQVDYFVSVDQCSGNTPLAINDFQNTYDEIEITSPGDILDLNVKVDISHTRTGELRLILKGEDDTAVMLSDRNGGEGDHYTNTIFDDQADVPVSEAQAPFTGRYMPEMPLSAFNGKPLAGNWQLRINDGGSGNSGTLNNWCLQFLYYDPSIGISNPELQQANLEQNYPNPANTSTSIGFSLPAASEVKLVVYDIYGQMVAQLADGQMGAGRHLVVAGLRNLQPGRYFYRLETEKFTATRSMVIVR